MDIFIYGIIFVPIATSCIAVFYNINKSNILCDIPLIAIYVYEYIGIMGLFIFAIYSFLIFRKCLVEHSTVRISLDVIYLIASIMMFIYSFFLIVQNVSCMFVSYIRFAGFLWMVHALVYMGMLCLFCCYEYQRYREPDQERRETSEEYEFINI